MHTGEDPQGTEAPLNGRGSRKKQLTIFAARRPNLPNRLRYLEVVVRRQLKEAKCREKEKKRTIFISF